MSDNVATVDLPQKARSEPQAHTPTKPFDEDEIQRFHTEDRHTCIAIVGIMFSILMLALIAYTSICFWVIAEPYQTFP